MNCKSTKSAIKHKNCTINKMVLYLCIKVSGRRRRMVISVGAQSAAVRTRYFAPAPTNEKSRRINQSKTSVVCVRRVMANRDMIIILIRGSL